MRLDFVPGKSGSEITSSMSTNSDSSCDILPSSSVISDMVSATDSTAATLSSSVASEHSLGARSDSGYERSGMSNRLLKPPRLSDSVVQG